MWTRLVIAVVIALVLGGLGYGWVSRLWRRWVLRRRRDQGRQGEVDAARLLADSGYEILEDQANREVAVRVDREPHGYVLRPDFLVRRRGREYVAEVKTGKKAPDPLYAATRRQLLEYAVCFPDHGLLLVDMEDGRVHRVEWEQLEARGAALERRRLRWMVGGAFGLGLALGALAALL